MHKFRKMLVLSCAVASCALFGAVHAEAASADGVKLQVNDTLVETPEAQPVLDGSSKLHVPFRPLMEKLGYKTEWSMEGKEVRVSMKKGEQTIELKTGDSFVLVNGKKVNTDSMIGMAQGNVYVPLRFISETIGTRVQWDEANQIAIVDEDGRYHAPAWYKPKREQPSNVVGVALTYIGAPYSWGGGTPKGFDCSGFVRYVFSKAQGAELPRTSTEMYDSAGVAVAEPEEGDLVYFYKKGAAHIGIYIGGGQFVSATTSHGVRVDSLSSAYWSSRYVGAKRI